MCVFVCVSVFLLSVSVFLTLSLSVCLSPPLSLCNFFLCLSPSLCLSLSLLLLSFVILCVSLPPLSFCLTHSFCHSLLPPPPTPPTTLSSSVFRSSVCVSVPPPPFCLTHSFSLSLSVYISFIFLPINLFTLLLLCFVLF